MRFLRGYLRLGLGTVASIVGIASGANSLFGGGSGSSGSGPGGTNYQPSGQPQIDQNFQKIIQQLMQSGQQQGATAQPGINAGYAATQPGGPFGNLQALISGYGNTLQNQGTQGQANENALYGAGSQVFQTALDPQNALRNQLQQQVTDASRAGTSARGIGMSGNAAGIENQDVNNFLINWQNQQLHRQLAGLQGMSGAYNAGATQANQVGRDVAGAAGLQNTAALLPFQFANAFSGASQGANQQLAGLTPQLLAYLGYGQTAGNNQFGQQQTGLNNLTTGLGQLGSIFNQPSSPSSFSGDPANLGGYYGGGGGT